METLASLARY